MTAVAERPGWSLPVVARVELDPPVRVRLDEIAAPHLVGDIPLRWKRVVVVADLREVALLPLRSVDEGDVAQLEGQKRIRRIEVRQHAFRVLPWVSDDVRHPGF